MIFVFRSLSLSSNHNLLTKNLVGGPLRGGVGLWLVILGCLLFPFNASYSPAFGLALKGEDNNNQPYQPSPPRRGQSLYHWSSTNLNKGFRRPMERERLCDSLRSQVGFYPFLPSLTVSFLPLIQPLVEKPSTRRKERNQRERLANPRRLVPVGLAVFIIRRNLSEDTKQRIIKVSSD